MTDVKARRPRKKADKPPEQPAEAPTGKVDTESPAEARPAYPSHEFPKEPVIYTGEKKAMQSITEPPVSATIEKAVDPQQPKPTSRTMAFKVMVGAWLGNACVVYLATRGFFIPDEMRDGLAGVITEGLNTFLPVLTTLIAGWLTKIVSEISKDKTVEKARALTAAQTRGAVSAGTIENLEVK